MAKKVEKEIFLCDDCVFFTDKCEHPSNMIITLSKRIEKTSYISLDKSKNCKFYIERH